MPITASAKKAIRQSLRRKVVNDRRRKTMRTAVKELKAAPAADKLALAYKAIDKAVKRGVMHKNTAARKKSQAARMVAKK